MLDTCVTELQNQQVPQYIRAKVYPHIMVAYGWSLLIVLLLAFIAWKVTRLQLST